MDHLWRNSAITTNQFIFQISLNLKLIMRKLKHILLLSVLLISNPLKFLNIKIENNRPITVENYNIRTPLTVDRAIISNKNSNLIKMINLECKEHNQLSLPVVDILLIDLWRADNVDKNMLLTKIKFELLLIILCKQMVIILQKEQEYVAKKQDPKMKYLRLTSLKLHLHINNIILQNRQNINLYGSTKLKNCSFFRA
jgi:hypothetical protein